MASSKTARRFYRVDSQHDLTAHMDRGESAIMENRWCLEIAWEAGKFSSYNALRLSFFWFFLHYLVFVIFVVCFKF